MQARTIQLAGVELSIAEEGSGQRPLLLVHGFCGAKEDFVEWLEPLAAAGWHAVCFDHRGHGESTKPSSEDAYTLDIFASDAFALVEALGWDQFALVGHSMGGWVSQVMATAQPERLLALTLMDTGHGAVEGLEPPMIEWAVSVVRENGIDALADILLATESPLLTPAYRRLLDERPGFAAFEERKLRSTSPAVYAAVAGSLLHVKDRLADLRALPPSLPCLVIVGEQDKPFLKASQAMAAAVPSASLDVIVDAGHSPQFENPDGWWSSVSGFLASVPA